MAVGSASTSHAFHLSRDEQPDPLNNGSGYEVSSSGSGSVVGGVSGTASSSNAVFDKLNDDNMLENDVELTLKKRMFVLRELVATEESYVKDLAMIVDGYIREIRDPDSDIVMPEDLRGGKERMIFGNVEAIYEWHREYVYFHWHFIMHFPLNRLSWASARFQFVPKVTAALSGKHVRVGPANQAQRT